VRGKVHIREFRIRASGLTREQGRRLGELVAKRLSEDSRETNGTKSVNEISIKFRSTTSSIDRLASDVTAHIRRRVN